ncbi:interferon-induced 6-16 family protein [Hirsutella rhossiliensis]|uniref:Interferon-induced 6-16 family domain-containing protein n=1 Tax=Hirsutella rhossiliensis TaxID=111463 RepID=A0A9P8SKR9_9HYPO|nr:interferon-induced 6-16 family domain-containing protein [Hirsutella rhossiliensis]KAH0966693.1 interferon-induced 6-16 family domain-containing protein [Hirsutella rhossiliensis]
MSFPGVIAAAALMVAAPALVATPLLGAAGFGAAGVTAGSAAAAVQSVMGSVVAPSLFSTLQSAAMGGYGVVVVHGAVQGLGALAAIIAGYMAGRKGDDGKDGEGDESAEGDKDEGGEDGMDGEESK